MSLCDDLKGKINKINDSDELWRNFVKDFKETIEATCQLVELTDYQKRIFKYRLRDLLKSIHISQDLSWIIIWLNQMETELNFPTGDTLKVPNYQYIQKLRALYDGGA